LELEGTLHVNNFNADVNLFAGGVLNMAGDISSSGTVTQNGGTLNYTSGQISGGTYEYLGGTTTGTPLLTGSKLKIGPSATNPVSFFFIDNNTLEGDAHVGQTLTILNNGHTATPFGLSSASGFTNNGSIILIGSPLGGSTHLNVAGTLTNSATGLLHFQSPDGGRLFTGDLANDGTVRIDQSTTFDKPSGQYTNNNQFIMSRNLALQNGGTLTNAATGVISGAATATATLTSTLNSAGIVRATSGTLRLAGTSTTNSGVFEALNASTLDVTAPLTNLSAGTLTGGTYRSVSTGGAAAMTVAGSPVTTIAAGTTVELSGAGATMLFGSTALQSSLTTNAGTLKIFNGHHFNMTNALANSGTVHLGGAALADGMLTAAAGVTNTGTITGHGTINGNIMNTSGTVAPGSSPGSLQVAGDYTQGAAGTLAIEVASATSHDILNVAGSAALDGTLGVSLIDGFSPLAGHSFDVMDWGTRSGTFANVSLPALTPRLMWNASRLYDTGALSVRLAGDYNEDNSVDAADYVVWRKTFGQTGAGLPADGDGSGMIDAADLDAWKQNFSLSTAARARTETVGSNEAIYGVVTNTTDLINSANSKSFYFQDGTGGMRVFGTTAAVDQLLAGVNEGHAVVITGVTTSFNGLISLEDIDGALSLTVIAAPGLVQPQTVATSAFADFSASAESLENSLVRLENVSFVESGSFAGLTNYTVTDGMNLAVVRVSTNQQDIVGTAIPTGPVDLVGIFNQFDTTNPAAGVAGTGYSLLLRRLSDIVPSGAGAGALAVPEPASVLVSVLALASVAMVNRRR
jgi:hypothetical protein